MNGAVGFCFRISFVLAAQMPLSLCGYFSAFFLSLSLSLSPCVCCVYSGRDSICLLWAYPAIISHRNVKKRKEKTTHIQMVDVDDTKATRQPSKSMWNTTINVLKHFILFFTPFVQFLSPHYAQFSFRFRSCCSHFTLVLDLALPFCICSH